MKKIDVIFKEDGSVEIRPEGYKGEECRQATAKLERAFGTVTSDTPTQELYEQEVKNNVDACR